MGLVFVIDLLDKLFHIRIPNDLMEDDVIVFKKGGRENQADIIAKPVGTTCTAVKLVAVDDDTVSLAKRDIFFAIAQDATVFEEKMNFGVLVPVGGKLIGVIRKIQYSHGERQVWKLFIHFDIIESHTVSFPISIVKNENRAIIS